VTGLLKIRAHPKLNSPNMVAAWPGIANVSSIALSYLKKRLDFKELGEVDAAHFFDPIGITVRDNVVEEPQFPQSRFYYWKNKKGLSDLILFVGEDQPPVKAYELANCVLDMAEYFKAKRVYTCAAAMTKCITLKSPKLGAWQQQNNSLSSFRSTNCCSAATCRSRASMACCSA
jgi:uncharacterized protein